MRKLYAIREVTSGMWLSTLKMRGFTSNFSATDSFFNTETNAYAAMHKLHTQIIKKGMMFRLDATWCKIYDDEQDALLIPNNVKFEVVAFNLVPVQPVASAVQKIAELPSCM